MQDGPPDPPNLRVFEAVPEASAEYDISDPELVRTLDESQRNHFWFHARNLQIEEFLRRDGAVPPARVLEAGCGMGTVLAALQDNGYEMIGVEMHAQLARRAAVRSPASSIFSLDIHDPPCELLRTGPFDVVAVFDVIEHLPEPGEFLRACAALLRPGGMLAGTVPALQALWSDYDVYAGHRLRYDPRSLRQLFARAWLPEPVLSYFFQVLVPGMLGRRALIGRQASKDENARRATQHLALDAPVWFLDRALAGACTIERSLRRFVPWLDRLPGTSIWFSARIADPETFRVEGRPTSRTREEP